MKANLTTQISIHLLTTVWFWNVCETALETTSSYEKLASSVFQHKREGRLYITDRTLKKKTPESIQSQGYVNGDSINLGLAQYKSGTESIPRGKPIFYQEKNLLGWGDDQLEHLLHSSASTQNQQDHIISSLENPYDRSSCQWKGYQMGMGNANLHPESKSYDFPCTKEFEDAFKENLWYNHSFFKDQALLQNGAPCGGQTGQLGGYLTLVPDVQDHEDTADFGDTLERMKSRGYSGNMDMMTSQTSELGLGLCTDPSTQGLRNGNVINMDTSDYPSGLDSVSARSLPSYQSGGAIFDPFQEHSLQRFNALSSDFFRQETIHESVMQKPENQSPYPYHLHTDFNKSCFPCKTAFNDAPQLSTHDSSSGYNIFHHENCVPQGDNWVEYPETGGFSYQTSHHLEYVEADPLKSHDTVGDVDWLGYVDGSDLVHSERSDVGCFLTQHTIHGSSATDNGNTSGGSTLSQKKDAQKMHRVDATFSETRILRRPREDQSEYYPGKTHNFLQNADQMGSDYRTRDLSCPTFHNHHDHLDTGTLDLNNTDKNRNFLDNSVGIDTLPFLHSYSKGRVLSQSPHLHTKFDYRNNSENTVSHVKFSQKEVLKKALEDQSGCHPSCTPQPFSPHDAQTQLDLREEELSGPTFQFCHQDIDTDTSNLEQTLRNIDFPNHSAVLDSISFVHPYCNSVVLPRPPIQPRELNSINQSNHPVSQIERIKQFQDTSQDSWASQNKNKSSKPDNSGKELSDTNKNDEIQKNSVGRRIEKLPKKSKKLSISSKKLLYLLQIEGNLAIGRYRGLTEDIEMLFGQILNHIEKMTLLGKVNYKRTEKPEAKLRGIKNTFVRSYLGCLSVFSVQQRGGETGEWLRHGWKFLRESIVQWSTMALENLQPSALDCELPSVFDDPPGEIMNYLFNLKVTHQFSKEQLFGFVQKFHRWNKNHKLLPYFIFELTSFERFCRNRFEKKNKFYDFLIPHPNNQSYDGDRFESRNLDSSFDAQPQDSKAYTLPHYMQFQKGQKILEMHTCLAELISNYFSELRLNLENLNPTRLTKHTSLTYGSEHVQSKRHYIYSNFIKQRIMRAIQSAQDYLIPHFFGMIGVFLENNGLKYRMNHLIATIDHPASSHIAPLLLQAWELLKTFLPRWTDCSIGLTDPGELLLPFSGGKRKTLDWSNEKHVLYYLMENHMKSSPPVCYMWYLGQQWIDTVIDNLIPLETGPCRITDGLDSKGDRNNKRKRYSDPK